jgi:Tfp pilus assembly protein PilV
MTPRARTGFTLVELLVAVVLIDVGLLALAGTTAVLVRRSTELRARSQATALAANRLQTLSITACQPRAGTAASANFAEHWAEFAASTTTRELRDSVTFTAYGAQHAVVLATKLPC